MAQGSESDVNRKGDTEKLTKHTEGVCTFVLKIHYGKKNSAPKIAEKIFSSTSRLLPFVLPIGTIFPQMDGCVSTINTKPSC